MKELFDLKGYLHVMPMEDIVSAGVWGMTVVGGNVVKNFWDGNVNLNISSIEPLYYKPTYTLSYANIPTGDICVNLARTTRMIGFDTMSINGTDEDIHSLTARDILSHCDDTTNNYVEFIWTYNTP